MRKENTSNTVFINDKKERDERYLSMSQPEYGNWKCYLYGSKPNSPTGTVITPTVENVPNIFARFFMKVLLGCTWVKSK